MARKPSLALVIGNMKKPSHDDEDMPESREGEDSESPHEDAAAEILDAVKAGDPAALSDALKVFYDLCKEEHGDEEY